MCKTRQYVVTKYQFILLPMKGKSRKCGGSLSDNTKVPFCE